MAFKDILLTLTSYPEPTPVSVLEDAVSIAATLGAHLAAVSCEVHVQVPGHFLSGSIANLPGIIAGEAEKSRKEREGPARRIRRSRGKGRRSARNLHGKMPDLRSPGPAGRLCAASRSHDRARPGILRSMVRGDVDLRIGPADPRSCRRPLARAHSNWEPSSSLGISAAPRPGRFPTRFPCSNAPRRYASSPSPTKRLSIRSTLPRNWPRTWRATASTWCWTRSTQTAGRSARFLKPMRFRIGPTSS